MRGGEGGHLIPVPTETPPTLRRSEKKEEWGETREGPYRDAP